MRRTTLGPVHSSTFNRSSLGASKARASVGGPARRGRASMAPSTAAASSSRRDSISSRRQSVAGGASASSGRMSIYGSGRGGGMRKADPRPLTSREFINEQLNDLIRYLLENEFNHRISPKLFNPPTGKEFKAVVTHLFRLLDGAYDMTGRVEDEVPLVFKGLRYPFGISKTGLTAVGSPHTWPALLGALSWLVDLLQYDTALRDREEEEDGEAEADIGDEKLFFRYLRASYEAFLAHDDTRFESLDIEIRDTFQSKQEGIESETTAIEEETARLRAELERVRAKKAELPVAQAKRSDLLSDKGKFETLIQQLHEHKAALEAKLAQREEEAAGKEAEQAEAEAELAATKKTIETQELSVDDVERIQAQRQRHLDKAAANGKQKEEARRELAEAEAALAGAIEGLESQLVQYHRAASDLHLLAPDDDNANGVDFELVLNTEHLTPDDECTTDTASILANAAAGRRESLTTQLGRITVADVLGTDVRTVIKPALRELKTTLHQQTVDERDHESELADRAESIAEAVEDCKMRLQEADKRVQGLNDTFKREKSALERTLSDLIEQTDAVELEVEEARSDLQRAEEDAASLDERALRRIREAANKRVQAAQAEADAAVTQLRDDTLAVARHVDSVRRKLQTATQTVSRTCESGAEAAKAMATQVERCCAE